MNKVFIDTNIFLDYIQQRPEGWREADAAYQLETKDFEDALQYYSAEQAEADCIVTRNLRDFDFPRTIPTMEPHSFLQKYFPEEL